MSFIGFDPELRSGSGFVILIVYYNLYSVKTGTNHYGPVSLVFALSHLFMIVLCHLTLVSINYIIQSALTKDVLVATGWLLCYEAVLGQYLIDSCPMPGWPACCHAYRFYTCSH